MAMLLSTYQTWCIPLDFIFPCAPGAVIISLDIIHSIWWLLSSLLSVMDRRLGNILSSKHSNIFSLKSAFFLSPFNSFLSNISCIILIPNLFTTQPCWVLFFQCLCVSHPLPFLYLCGTQAYCSQLKCSTDLIKPHVRIRWVLRTHGWCRVLCSIWGYFALKAKMSWLYKS